jgi:DNA-binding NarL/FixJ family response regulator
MLRTNLSAASRHGCDAAHAQDGVMNPGSERTDGSTQRAVVVIDRNPLVRRAVAQLITEHGGLNLYAVEASMIPAHGSAPAIVIISLNAPDGDMLQLVRAVRERYPVSFILVLGWLDDPAYHHASVAAGANRFIANADITTTLLPIIHEALEAQDNLATQTPSCIEGHDDETSDDLGRGRRAGRGDGSGSDT